MAIIEPSAHTLEELESDVRGMVDLARHQPVRLSIEGQSGILMVPEDQLDRSDEILYWVRAHLHAAKASRKPAALRTSEDFPGASWLQYLDDEDLDTFLEELRQSLLEAVDSNHLDCLRQLVSDWETTANVLSDPNDSATLCETFDPDNFIEVSRPA